MAQEDPPGKPAQRVAQVVMAHLVLLVRGDHLDLRDQWGLPDLKDPLAQLGKTVCLDTLGSEGKLVSKARQVRLVLLVLLALRALQERLVPWGNVVTQAHLGHLENKVCPGLQGKKVQRVTLVQQDLSGRMVHQASEDSPVSEDSPDPPVRSV